MFIMNWKEEMKMKSTYLKRLKQRKESIVKKVKEGKEEVLVDKVFGRNVMFVRDYSVFAVGPKCGKALLRRNKDCLWEKECKSCLNVKPDVKVKVRSRSEIEFPYKYDIYKEDGFTRMYKHKHKHKQQKQQHNINVYYNNSKQQYNSHSSLNKINAYSYKHINNSLISSLINNINNNNSSSKLFTNGKLKQYNNHSHILPPTNNNNNSYLASIAKGMIITPSLN